jgi:L-asparaginase/Glu-tRNA(Gln) amidotransferase subunit D
VASPTSVNDSTLGIAVERLSPLHARILLMFALTKTNNPDEIQRIFSEY